MFCKSDEVSKVCEIKSKLRVSTADSDTRRRAFKSVEMTQRTENKQETEIMFKRECVKINKVVFF